MKAPKEIYAITFRSVDLPPIDSGSVWGRVWERERRYTTKRECVKMQRKIIKSFKLLGINGSADVKIVKL